MTLFRQFISSAGTRQRPDFAPIPLKKRLRANIRRLMTRRNQLSVVAAIWAEAETTNTETLAEAKVTVNTASGRLCGVRLRFQRL